MSRCGLLLAIATGSDDNCERYSIYRSTIFGEDDLLWEETTCEYDSVGLEERFKEKNDLLHRRVFWQLCLQRTCYLQPINLVLFYCGFA